MMDAPTISVITPVYNGAKYLPDLIESVQSQTYTHYEHIIIDDGSSDDGATVSILEKYANDDPHIRWWSHEKKGQYATQNDGLKAAKGDYIVVIAADDIFTQPDSFSVVVRYLEKEPSCDVVYGKTRRMDVHGNPLPYYELSWTPSRWLIKHIVYAQHCSVFVSRKFLTEKSLYFSPSYRYVGDWDWIIRVFTQSQSIGYIKHFIATIRSHDNQTSRTADRSEIAKEHKQICEIHNSSYGLHVLISNMNNYRAMSLIALHTLRTQGLMAFIKKIANWVNRKVRA